MRRVSNLGWLGGVVMLSVVGCAGEGSVEEGIELRTSHLSSSGKNGGPSDGITTGVSVTAGGDAVQLGRDGAEVSVVTRGQGRAWSAARNVVVDFNSPPLIDAVLVADNSGSLASDIVEIKEAVKHFAHVILARSHDDRVGLVRVSTEAVVTEPLTVEAAELTAAADQLFAANGWTALWDGVRVANETLADATLSVQGDSACYAGSYPSIIVITDGKENNSADQHRTSYVGDGVDTSFDDLARLAVRGRPTAIHTVAVGDEADSKALKALSDATGGHFTKIQNYGQLVGTLHGTAAKLSTTVPVCFEPATCGDVEAKISVTVGRGKNAETAELVAALPQTACD